MFILLLWQCFFVTRWLEEERLRLLASVVVVRSERALGCGCLVLELGTGVTKNSGLLLLVVVLRHQHRHRPDWQEAVSPLHS